MVVLSAEMQWIASTLCKVCIHSWHAFVALVFLVDLMFLIDEKVKEKTPLFSIDCDLKMQEMAS